MERNWPTSRTCLPSKLMCTRNEKLNTTTVYAMKYKRNDREKVHSNLIDVTNENT